LEAKPVRDQDREGPPFSLLIEPLPENRSIISMEGELDLATAPRLRAAISSCVDSGAHHVVIDLTKVTFVDSTALGVIIVGLREVRDQGGTLSIVCPNPRVLRAFKLTGLLRVLDNYETREGALECAPREPQGGHEHGGHDGAAKPRDGVTPPTAPSS
jgi:anti-sigma B factor antagonist